MIFCLFTVCFVLLRLLVVYCFILISVLLVVVMCFVSVCMRFYMCFIALLLIPIKRDLRATQDYALRAPWDQEKD